jgi:tetratricopeptide (TPR) repeat protein/TolB-like protein
MERALAGVSQQIVAPTPSPTWTRQGLRGFGIAACALLATVVALIVWSRVIESRRGVVLSQVRTIGVLPMADLTNAAVPENFVDGLTDELIGTLGQVKGLTIKPAATAGSRDERPLQDIARSLDVDALLETTMSAQGDGTGPAGRVKVRAKLISAGTQAIVWTEEFDRPRGATLELPGVVAAAIARAVNLMVSTTESSRLTARQQTNPQMEEAYLQGRTRLDQYGNGNAEQALQAFERALQFDPNHPGARAGAARAYLTLGMNGRISHTRARVNARREAQRALELDPDLAEAHAILASIKFRFDWEWPDAERDFLRSLELNPNSAYARIVYAEELAAIRRFDDSVAQAVMAKRVDPASGAVARKYALILYYQGDFAGAEAALQEAEAIEPNNAGLPLLQARVAEARGRFADALELTTRALQLSPGESVPLKAQQIRQQVLAGRRADALVALQALEREAATNGGIHLTPRDRAYIQLALGNKERAIELFAQAVEERDPTVIWLGVDPRLDALQHDARFRELLRVVGLPLMP